MSPTALLLFFCVCSAAEVFHLDVYVRQPNLGAFEKKYWEISTPGSGSYLKFLSREDIASEIGASKEDLGSVKLWLKNHGGIDVTVSALRDVVSATFTTLPASLKSGRNGIPHKESYPACVNFIVRRDVRESPMAAVSRVSELSRRSMSATAVDPDYSINNIKQTYGIPLDLQASNEATLQMVWGSGTFGYSSAYLRQFKDEQHVDINMDKIQFDTDNHGEPGGDNFMEGQLDTDMISAFGLNVSTLVSNTNTSASTEETTGFGAALLDFLVNLAAREVVPHVLSMSLGSLSAASCDLLCEKAVSEYGHSQEECED